MGFKCERCKKSFKGEPSMKEYLISSGVKIVCSRCYKPENNEKYKEYQREMQKEKDKGKENGIQISADAEEFIKRRLRRQSQKIIPK
jgi:hypothetical protein